MDNHDAVPPLPQTKEAERAPKRALIPFDPVAVRARLVEGVNVLNLPLTREQMARLQRFVEALHRINQIHNLTAIRDPLEIVSKHVLDSLTVLPFLRTETLVDVGSGGGVPGIPLLIAGGANRAVLIDSVQKKMRCALEIAAASEMADRVQALGERVESLRADLPALQGCTQIISRAFSNLANFVQWTGHLLPKGGELLAMKGAYPEAELSALPKGWRLLRAHQLSTPFVEGERCLIVLGKTGR
jgi:16S rRNA (guanine527-N7)-methyltransferase